MGGAGRNASAMLRRSIDASLAQGYGANMAFRGLNRGDER